MSGVTVQLTGGLGNQLFILAAGLAQAKRLGCHLYLDASRYVGTEARNLELQNFEIPNSTIVYSKENSKTKHRRAWLPLRHRGDSVYSEGGFNFDASINNVTPGVRLVGYFQSPKYFQGLEREMLSIIESAEGFNASDNTEAGGFNKSVSVHMRRGDYLEVKTGDFHGLTSMGYYSRAESLMQRLIGPHEGRVFSDSPEIVSQELGSFKSWHLVETGVSSPIQTLGHMSRADALIISNSSFSWWAAWIQSQRGPTTVIAPRPWFANGDSASDLLLESWITLSV